MSPGESPDQRQDDNLETLFLTDEELVMAQKVADWQGVTVDEALSSACGRDLKRRFMLRQEPGTVVPLKRG
jgi:hypothetical protein